VHLYEATEAEKVGGSSSRTVVSALEQCPSARVFVQVAGISNLNTKEFAAAYR
jgi:hypothetical protein